MAKQKTNLVVPVSVPRNPLAVLGRQRCGAGSHGKSGKAQRRQDKVSVQRGAW